MKGDRSKIIGLILIGLVSFVYMKYFMPEYEQVEAELTAKADSLATVQETEAAVLDSVKTEQFVQMTDSAKLAENSAQFGVFAPVSYGTEEILVLENSKLRLEISTKGGKIVNADILGYDKITEGEKNKEIKEQLSLLNNKKNKFAYQFILNQGLKVSSEDLYFAATNNDGKLTLTADLGNGAKFVQMYSLDADTYNVNYDIQITGMGNYLDTSIGGVKLRWENNIEALEKNATYEKNYSTVYFKPADETADHCSCTGDDTEEPEGKLKWISTTNQFFNTSIIASTAFKAGNFETEVYGDDEEALKKVSATVTIPSDELSAFSMDMYIGPNKFENLRAYDVELTDIVPFGSSIFGTVNRWVIRPIFSFFSKYFNNLGLAIILLTLVVKLALYPLQYKMIHSQAKMGVLKPKLAALKEKYPDDQQKVQMELEETKVLFVSKVKKSSLGST